MGISLIISSIKNIQHAYVSREMQFKKFFYSTMFGTVISAVVGIAMAINNYGVWALVAQTLTKSVVDMLVLSITIDLKIQIIFSKKSFKRLFPYGFKLMITNFLGNLFNQFKNFIIGTKYTSTDLAYSTKGEQIPNVVVSNINSSIESVLFSSISKLNNNLDVMKMAVRKALKITTFIIMPLMFGVVACAQNIVEVLYTNKWKEIIPYLQILSFQNAFSIIGSMNLQVINARGRSDISLKLEFIKKPIFLIFILFGMKFGPFYIVLANVLYSFVGSTINAIPNKKLLNYSIKEQIIDITPNLFSSIIMLLVVMLIGNILSINKIFVLLIQIILGGLIYLGIQRLLNNESLYFIINYVKVFLNNYILRKKKNN